MHARARSSAAAAACALAVATLAGCGGSSSGGGSSALTKTQLDAQANAICAAESKAGEAIPAPSNINDATQAAAYFDKVDPVISGATAKLEALTPDSDAATDWNAFIALRKQLTALIHTVREKADAKDPSGLQDLTNSQALGKQVDTAATKVGAASCAE
jgi:hypothetical protein